MVFSSPTFLFVFLPAVLVATWCVPQIGRRWVLLGASLVFYAWGVQEFVGIIMVSTLVDWALARAMAKELARGETRRARAFLLLGIAQNLGLLAWFKYAGFATEQVSDLLGLLGFDSPGTVSVLLPIGISFFTFEKLSYLIDVWRGDVEARRDPVDLLLFVALFPRSIAGPIVRLREIQDDLSRPQPTIDLATSGAIRFSHGLAKKVLIADQIAPIADTAFLAASTGDLTTGAAWLGAVAYSLQLYFDFSAYSDMAIGIGMMLGFRLPENFNRPYSSVSMTDFWRRWHMTLSRWFRDYVYISLGGNRGGHTVRNLLIVFFLTGLWHGAAWAFVLWGLYHGAWLILERKMGWRALGDDVRYAWARRAITLLIVLIGWVLFRAEHLDLALDYYRAMVVPTGGPLPEQVALAADHQAIFALLVGALVVFLPRRRSTGRLLVEGTGPVVMALRTGLLAAALPLALTLAFASNYSPFLYFQF